LRIRQLKWQWRCPIGQFARVVARSNKARGSLQKKCTGAKRIPLRAAFTLRNPNNSAALQNGPAIFQEERTMEFNTISDEQLDQVTGGGLLDSIVGLLDETVGLVEDTANSAIDLVGGTVNALADFGLGLFGNTISVFRSVLGGVIGTLRGIISFS
jgi:bacteriocin-like protein